MKLKELQDAMIAAMKAKDKFRKDAISALVSAVKKKESTTAAVTTFPMRWLTKPS